MRRAVLAATLLGAVMLSAGAASAASPDPLLPYRWKQRVVLVLAAPDDPALAGQRRLFAPAARDFAEREMVVLEPSEAEATLLRRRYRTAARGFVLVLVGKDGEGKYRAVATVAPETLIAQVDAMPMRQDEMQRQ